MPFVKRIVVWHVGQCRIPLNHSAILRGFIETTDRQNGQVKSNITFELSGAVYGVRFNDCYVALANTCGKHSGHLIQVLPFNIN